MGNADKCLYHHEINKLYEIRQSLPISVGDLQQIGLLFLLSAFEIHGLLLNLLSELHLILLFHIFDVAFLVDLVLNFANNHCHLVGDYVFILRTCHLAGLVLLNVELGFHLPSFVVSDLIKYGPILPQIIQASVDFHQILCKCRLGNEHISD